ncbi:MAG: hypothetical protein K2G13_08770, partial [Muribaculaceae bacterium]|nr:hypothetical protein [Muribaculaceae bacterium]
MFTLEELESWDDVHLQKVAEEFGMKNSSSADRQELVYHIIDNQAINKAKEIVKSGQGRRASAKAEATGDAPQQKKRGRKPKAKSTEEVAQEPTKTVSTPEQHPVEDTVKENVVAENPEKEAATAPTPKKRGRKSKAELAAIQAQKEAEYKDATETENSTNPDNELNPQPAVAPEQPKKRGRKPGQKKNSPQGANTQLPLLDAQPEEIQTKTEVTDKDNSQAEETSKAEEIKNTSAEDKSQRNQQKRRDFQPHKNDGFDSFFGNSKGRTFKPRHNHEAQENNSPAVEPPPIDEPGASEAETPAPII